MSGVDLNAGRVGSEASQGERAMNGDGRSYRQSVSIIIIIIPCGYRNYDSCVITDRKLRKGKL